MIGKGDIMALNTKQKRALELLTCGLGLKYSEIAKEVGVSEPTLYRWRNDEPYREFQEALEQLNQIRWQAAEDAAREGCINLCKEGNQRMIEFVLKNIGYNPTQKLEADINSTISITIGDDEEEENA